MSRAPRWTPDQLGEYKARGGTFRAVPAHRMAEPPDRYRNKQEREYGALLEAKKRVGDIIDYKYEPYSIRLADRTHIKPDFAVVVAAGQEIHEVKGFPRPAWLAKWKIFKEMYRREFVRFLVCRKVSGAWRIEA